MRRRPEVEIRFLPATVLPGRTLEVHAQFASRTVTPVDTIDFTLRGTESVTMGSGDGAQTYERNLVGLRSRVRPERLTPGVHRHLVRFAIPYDAPPSYRGTYYRVGYELEVHVDIPWWPDVRNVYDVTVAHPPVVRARPEAQLFVTSASGPAGRELYAELSLESIELAPGEPLVGAVSLANAQHAGVRAVEIAFVATEELAAGGRRETGEATRYRAVLTRVPDAGEALPFRITLPSDAPPSTRGFHGGLAWTVEVAAVTLLSRRVLLRVPAAVVPATSGAHVPRASGVPLVGRERRAALWATVAQGAGLVYEPERDAIRGRAGEVSVAITVEDQASGPATVARLAWPTLGLALAVGPAHWSDALVSAEIDVGDAEFDARFSVRGRERAQVVALLDEPVRRAVSAFDEARLDDAGATLVARTSSASERDLRGVAARAMRAARAIADASARVPPPAPLAAHLGDWEAFARRLSARLERGRLWLHHGSFGVDRVELGASWRADGAFDATVIRVALDPPIASAVDPSESVDALPAGARALAAEVARDARRVTIGPDAISVELASMVTNPATLEPALDRLARLARALRGATSGPFR